MLFKLIKFGPSIIWVNFQLTYITSQLQISCQISYFDVNTHMKLIKRYFFCSACLSIIFQFCVKRPFLNTQQPPLLGCSVKGALMNQVFKNLSLTYTGYYYREKSNLIKSDGVLCIQGQRIKVCSCSDSLSGYIFLQFIISLD